MTLSGTCKDPPPKDIVSGLVTSGSAYLFTKAGDLYLFSASLFKQSSGSVDVTVVKAEEAWPTGGAGGGSSHRPPNGSHLFSLFSTLVSSFILSFFTKQETAPRKARPRLACHWAPSSAASSSPSSPWWPPSSSSSTANETPNQRRRRRGRKTRTKRRRKRARRRRRRPVRAKTERPAPAKTRQAATPLRAKTPLPRSLLQNRPPQPAPLRISNLNSSSSS